MAHTWSVEDKSEMSDSNAMPFVYFQGIGPLAKNNSVGCSVSIFGDIIFA